MNRTKLENSKSKERKKKFEQKKIKQENGIRSCARRSKKELQSFILIDQTNTKAKRAFNVSLNFLNTMQMNLNIYSIVIY